MLLSCNGSTTLNMTVRKKKMLQTIVECAEDMVEIVPEGMDTVDVSGLKFVIC